MDQISSLRINNFLQIKEFRIMGLSINDSVYSCLFFFLTGLHFFHIPDIYKSFSSFFWNPFGLVLVLLTIGHLSGLLAKSWITGLLSTNSPEIWKIWNQRLEIGHKKSFNFFLFPFETIWTIDLFFSRF